MMDSKRLTLPDLGLDDEPIVLSLWLVKERTRVEAGDPVVEVMAGCVTVDLPAPSDGILATKLANEGDRLVVGQQLAIIEAEFCLED